VPSNREVLKDTTTEAKAGHPQSLVRRLFLPVLSLYLLLALALTTVQMSFEISHVRSDIREDLASLGKSFQGAITGAAWALDQPQIHYLIDGMARSHAVSVAAMVDPNNQVLARADDAALRDYPAFLMNWVPAVEVQIPLYFESPRGKEYLGQLQLISHANITLDRLSHSVFVVLLYAVLMTTGLWLIIYYILKRQLIAPIRRLEEGVRHIDYESMDRAVLPTYPFQDELGRLVDSMKKMQTRLAQAIQDASQARSELEGRLAERTAEIETAQRKLSAIEVARSRHEERHRLLEDMHDGFGSQLLSARLMIEGNAMSQPQLAKLIGECMDDLHLVVDLMSNQDQSLQDALVDYRHRLQQRSMDWPLQLHWQLDLANCPAMSDHTILQILRIVQEALTNALKHGHGSQIHIAAQMPSTDRLCITVENDGLGFSSNTHAGRGLNNMHKRALAIGGHLEMTAADSEGNGTRVTLHMPLQSG
jgi:signal transduction histidine kinase